MPSFHSCQQRRSQHDERRSVLHGMIVPPKPPLGHSMSGHLVCSPPAATFKKAVNRRCADMHASHDVDITRTHTYISGIRNGRLRAWEAAQVAVGAASRQALHFALQVHIPCRTTS
eukprot:1143778-Pelagomonas_calceolata.AAC.3